MISQYKENAKMSLKGNWGNAIVVFLGIYFLGGLINSIPQYFVMPTLQSSLNQLQYMDEFHIEEFLEIFAVAFGVLFLLSIIISIFVISVLQLGYQRFSIKLAREDHADPDVIFDGFKNHYWVNVKSLFRVVIYSFLWNLPAFILFGVGIYYAAMEESMFSIFFLLGTVASLFAAIKVIRYSLVPFLLMDDTVSFETGKEYLDESIRIMKGNVLEIILLALSFILWFFFLMITFGFGILYVGPYMQQSFTNFYLHHKEVKNIAYQ